MFSFSVVGAQLYVGDMVYIAVSFIILMCLIKLVAWKPVTKMMKDRSDKIANDIDSAEKSRADATKLAEQRQTELASTRQEASTIISEAKQTGQKQSDKIVEDAQNNAASMKVAAEKDIEQQRQEALANSKKDVASLSIEIASKIISKDLNSDDHKALVDSYIEGLGKHNESR